MKIKRQSIAFNILNNFKEVYETNPFTKATEILNDNFNKGLINELETEEAFEQLDSLIEKGHKYYKREGTPGNYKYYYTEQEYREAKSGKKEESNTDSFKIGDKVKLQDGYDESGKPVVREYTVTQPGSRAAGDRLKDNELYLTSPGVMGFDASIDWLNKNVIKETDKPQEKSFDKDPISKYREELINHGTKNGDKALVEYAKTASSKQIEQRMKSDKYEEQFQDKTPEKKEDKGREFSKEKMKTESKLLSNIESKLMSIEKDSKEKIDAIKNYETKLKEHVNKLKDKLPLLEMAAEEYGTTIGYLNFHKTGDSGVWPEGDKLWVTLSLIPTEKSKIRYIKDKGYDQNGRNKNDSELNAQAEKLQQFLREKLSVDTVSVNKFSFEVGSSKPSSGILVELWIN